MIMKKILALLISGVFATTMASQAAVITMPSGLSHGDQYRIVFVTSTTIQATSSDISTYNAHVTAAAALNPDLAVIEGTVEQTTTWTAIGSTDSVNARDNTSTTGAGTGIGIYLLNDTAIATELHRFVGWEPSPTFSTLTSRGTADPMPTARCGREPMVTDQQAMTLSVPQHREFGQGLISPALHTWINRLSGSSWPNTDTYHLFAISGILTVPEPSSTALLGLGGLALMLRRKRS